MEGVEKFIVNKYHNIEEYWKTTKVWEGKLKILPRYPNINSSVSKIKELLKNIWWQNTSLGYNRLNQNR